MKKAQLGIKEIIYLALGLLVLLLGFIAYNHSGSILEAMQGSGEGIIGDLSFSLFYLVKFRK